MSGDGWEGRCALQECSCAFRILVVGQITAVFYVHVRDVTETSFRSEERAQNGETDAAGADTEERCGAGSKADAALSAFSPRAT